MLGHMYKIISFSAEALASKLQASRPFTPKDAHQHRLRARAFSSVNTCRCQTPETEHGTISRSVPIRISPHAPGPALSVTRGCSIPEAGSGVPRCPVCLVPFVLEACLGSLSFLTRAAWRAQASCPLERLCLGSFSDWFLPTHLCGSSHRRAPDRCGARVRGSSRGAREVSSSFSW